MPYAPKRLSPEQVSHIRLKYSSGKFTQGQLALEFGVSQPLICKIVNNQVHKLENRLTIGGCAGVRMGYKYANQG